MGVGSLTLREDTEGRVVWRVGGGRLDDRSLSSSSSEVVSGRRCLEGWREDDGLACLVDFGS